MPCAYLFSADLNAALTKMGSLVALRRAEDVLRAMKNVALASTSKAIIDTLKMLEVPMSDDDPMLRGLRLLHGTDSDDFGDAGKSRAQPCPSAHTYPRERLTRQAGRSNQP